MKKDTIAKGIFALFIVLAILLGFIGGLYAAPLFGSGGAPKDGTSPDAAPLASSADSAPSPDTAPSPAPEQKAEVEDDKTLSALQESLDLFIAEKEFDEGDKWAVYVIDTKSEKDAGSFYKTGKDEKMIAASLIKIFIAGAVYKEAEVSGNFVIGPETSAWIETMLRDSNNDSANELIKILGGGDYSKGFEKVNDFADSISCSNTRLDRKLLDQNAKEDNFTTVSDCAKALLLVAKGSFVNKSASEDIYSYLLSDSAANSNKETKIRAGVYEISKTADVANKTGENFPPAAPCVVENDVAIVSYDNTQYILCIMSNSGSSGGAKDAIKEISKITHQFFLREE